MTEIVGIRGEPVEGFDTLANRINGAAQLLANVALAANISTNAARSEFFARKAVEIYDAQLGPAITQMRARLANANPFGEAP